jgi:hypothetical protein
VSRADEAQRVWDFLGQTEAALVPLGFSPLRSGLPTQEVDAMLLLLDSAGAKMSNLEDAIGDQLEAEGRVLSEVVAEHVLMCFQSRDPQVSLELVVQGPIEEMKDVARGSVQDTTRLVAAWFER